MSNEPSRPLPLPSPESAPWWEGLRQGRLLLQTCKSCGLVRHPPRWLCDACLDSAVEWRPASGHGRVHSWTVIHHAFHPSFVVDLPYVLIIADLAEGVRLQAPLRGAGADQLTLGRAVRVVFESPADGWVLPAFELA
jgi:uncharacterized OB-fold protein